MDPHDHRAMVGQLADDLSWLEEYCRRQPELNVHTAHLRLAAALTRNVIGPALDGMAATPTFVAVVGGAGAGKSTVVNFLAGAVVAEANPQAGYTRHPTAFLPAGNPFSWPTHNGFLGPLQRTTQTQPGNVDEDVYQVRRIPPPEHARDGDAPANPLADVVVWDCPDMTTWASTHYVSRLLEVVALADVVVYVASDERYNDEVPTQFMHLLIRAGKAVVVCLTKAREADAPGLIAHFRQEVLGRLPALPGADVPPIPCIAVPQIPAAVRADPAGLGAAYRIPLLNQLFVLSPSPEQARERTVRNALRYLEMASEGLLDVVRRDLTELETWRQLVEHGRLQFEQRYQTEYLAVETFHRFDRTREQVLAMLDLPGPGKVVTAVLTLLRAPWKYARDFLVKTLVRPEVPHQSEAEVCADALAGWLNGLQAEALQRSGSHPVWKHVVRRFETNLKTQARTRFDAEFRRFELKETDELDQAVRAVPAKLAANPGLLNALRAAVVGADLAAAGAATYLLWPPGWGLLLAIPLAVSAAHQLAELAVSRVVDAGRHRIKDHREDLLREHLSRPLATWLIDQPTAEGSSMERLSQILDRVPRTIRGLVDRLAAEKAAAAETGGTTP